MSAPVKTRSGSGMLAIALLVGAAVAVGLGVYGKYHEPSLTPLFGITNMASAKAWGATIVIAFAIIQLITALWMWGRLPGAGEAPGWVGPLHRWSGTIAFVVSLPVAFQCLWALGFATSDTRVLVHSLAGCLFYGAFATKMLGLRFRALPKWALPVLGGAVFTLLVVVWLTSALWLFTQPSSY